MWFSCRHFIDVDFFVNGSIICDMDDFFDPDCDFDDALCGLPHEYRRLRVRLASPPVHVDDHVQREQVPMMAHQDESGQVFGSPCMITRRMIRVYQLQRRHAGEVERISNMVRCGPSVRHVLEELLARGVLDDGLSRFAERVLGEDGYLKSEISTFDRIASCVKQNKLLVSERSRVWACKWMSSVKFKRRKLGESTRLPQSLPANGCNV